LQPALGFITSGRRPPGRFPLHVHVAGALRSVELDEQEHMFLVDVNEAIEPVYDVGLT
jgi:hypothetical protein